MFDSNRLQEKLRTKASGIRPPQGHEERIRLLYERQLRRRNRGPFGGLRRPVFAKVSAVVLVLAVLSGFTGYYYFNISDQRVSFTYRQPVSGWMDAAASARIYELLAEVEAGLEAGESAIVYVPELAERYTGKLALVSVMRPQTVTDAKQWEAELAEAGEFGLLAEAVLPDAAANGWSFDRGQRQPPFGGRLGERDLDWLPELERESEASGGGAAWRIRPPDSGEPESKVYTSFYRNAAGEEIYVSVEIVDRKTDNRIMSSLAETEEVGLHGEKAYYLRTEPFMFAESNRHHQVQWLQSTDDATWVISVGSSSPEVEKAELLQMAGEVAQARRTEAGNGSSGLSE